VAIGLELLSLGPFDMDAPDLTRIVDTYIPIRHAEPNAYLDQLRRDVVPFIRGLQKDGLLRWFAFLIHGSDMLDGREPTSTALYVHLRFEPESGIGVTEFIRKLPQHFCKPIQKTLANIDGVELSVLRNEDWANAWKIHGEASEWVLCLLESHSKSPIPLQQLVQFLHFITNPLMLGHRCLCIPAGFLSF
jgi:hypothetical protein